MEEGGGGVTRCLAAQFFLSLKLIPIKIARTEVFVSDKTEFTCSSSYKLQNLEIPSQPILLPTNLTSEKANSIKSTAKNTKHVEKKKA